MDKQHCIILGGGHAGAQLATSLRQQGWRGAITMVSQESVPPYQRPPLSKGYLAGELGFDQLLIKSAQAYETADIQLKLGVRAERIERQSRQVHLANGEVLRYTDLALTLGAQVRRLRVPGSDLDGVFHLHTVADLERIKAHIASGAKRNAVIIGGGYIGLETAAVLSKLGMQVTVLEAMPRLLQRVTTADVAGFYERLHAEEGVTILCNRTVNALLGQRDVEAVVCEGGETLRADLVIVGIGVTPHTDLAAAAGLTTNHGIVVDEFAQTSDPRIVAAGDCTEFFGVKYGRMIHLQSVPNAMGQAACAAATLCGKPVAYQAQPWFWSDQYDVKLQMAGLSQGHDQVVVRGDHRTGRSFSVYYLAAGKLIALDCVNQPKEFMQGKKMIASEQVFNPSHLLNLESPKP
ncbi:NAD(P)/FAD-dependent oxidoreductase [Duganella hordei]|uniref:NAD(P)/FAD-dependent oxidoreductase n=1 Tax=Duganella hordei TaxID=2865934 RepID=UPI0033406731